jgi:hypothetical protein
MTGCLPSFAVFIRAHINAKRKIDTKAGIHPYNRNTNSIPSSKPPYSFQSWRTKPHVENKGILLTNTDIEAGDLKSSTTRLGVSDPGVVEVYATDSDRSLRESEVGTWAATK